MIRTLSGLNIRQNHKTGMFNANDLHKVGNSDRKIKKQMAQYFLLDSTADLIDELCLLDNVEESNIKITKRGKEGGTWVSPELFVDMAMWYSPKLKAVILRWVVDGLLNARDNSGESYKAMTQAISLNFNPQDRVIIFKRIANQISCACKVGVNKDKWQTATQEQLELRDKIQNTIATIAEFCDSPSDCTSRAINKALK